MKLKKKVISLVLAVLVGIGCGWYINSQVHRAPVVSADMIETKIDSISEINGAQMVYRGLITYTDGDIPFINQKGFSMIYDAKIKAGIDFSKVKVDVDNNSNTIVVSVPKATITSIEINPDTIKLCDRKYAVLNWNKQEDVTVAMSHAKKDATTKAEKSALVKQAQDNTSAVIKSVLSGIADRKSVV